ncbi:MAG: 50S ribosomal protein L24 [Patescibacteria group bacterium]|nr:50S ribosomal protein L24 [Patescibacteria group bacterium]
MNIKKGDMVQVIAGANRGKRGKVLAVSPTRNRIIIEGVNLIKKHQRPRNEGEKGEVISVPRSMDVSNALHLCASCDKGVRVGTRNEGDAKVRYCKNCEAPIEK